jgi:hypothetical protein
MQRLLCDGCLAQSELFAPHEIAGVMAAGIRRPGGVGG